MRITKHSLAVVVANWKAHWVTMLLLWLAVMSVFCLSGCATSWVTEATSILQLLGPAISAALGILAAFGTGIPPSVMTTIQAALNTGIAGITQILQWIEQYNSETPDQQKNILLQIQNAIQAIKDNIGSVLSNLSTGLPSDVLAKIQAVLGAVIAEVEALEALVPVLVAKGTLTEEDIQEHLGVSGSPLLLAKQWKPMFKRILTAPTGNADLDKLTVEVAKQHGF